MRQAKGFTLIELLLVIAIIGILAAIATPMYNDYMRKSKRAEAKSLLMQVASRQEQFYLNNKTYTDDMTLLGFDADPIVSEGGHYQVDATAAGATSFALQATALGDQTNDICKNLTLDSDGKKGTTATGPVCW